MAENIWATGVISPLYPLLPGYLSPLCCKVIFLLPSWCLEKVVVTVSATFCVMTIATVFGCDFPYWEENTIQIHSSCLLHTPHTAKYIKYVDTCFLTSLGSNFDFDEHVTKFSSSVSIACSLVRWARLHLRKGVDIVPSIIELIYLHSYTKSFNKKNITVS